MLKLTDDLLIGHPVIDTDHRRLVEIINEFLAQSKYHNNAKLLHETLKSLMLYGKEHFSHEEKIQRACMYPNQVRHYHEHRVLLEQVQETARAYFIAKTRPLSDDSVAELNNFLKVWLIGHVKKHDAQMRDWVAADGGAAHTLDMAPLRDMAGLVVAPEGEVRNEFAALLKATGIDHVVHADDGASAIKAIFSDPVPDFVIAPLQMEPVDGLAVTGAIRNTAADYVANIPIVLYSDTEEPDLIHKAMASGASGLFNRPFEAHAFARFLIHSTRKSEA